MELAWCRSFIAVYEQGGFSAAARVIHRSQSRISAHIADLETHLGQPLLHRDVHPPTLTEAGATFLPHTRAAVADWSAGAAAVALQRGEVAGTVSVGSIPSVSSQILAPLIAEFGREYPDVVFEIHEGPNTWLDDALAHRTVEITLRPLLTDKPPTGVRARPLLRDRFAVICPRTHPLAAADSVALSALGGSAVITTGEAGLDARIGGEFREVLSAVAVDRAHSFAVTQPSTVFAMVRAGLGLGLIGALPAQMLTDDELVARPVTDARAERVIGLCWASTRPMSAATARFLVYLDEFFRHREDLNYIVPPAPPARAMSARAAR